jgi:KDO2-lipid IV(A) lauroyltransferase
MGGSAATARSVASRGRKRPQLLASSYRVAARALRATPAGLRHAAAAPGGAAWFWLSARQRRAALENYAAVLGRDAGDPEVARVARRAFQNYGRMLLDFVLIGSLTPADLQRRVTYDGREHLDAAVAAGHGAIVAAPHMGSWDMAGSLAGALGYRVTAVAERFPGSLNDAVIETRERFGVRVITLGRAAVRGITQALEANGIVALICDLEQGPGVKVRFFDRWATVPVGPAAFAVKAHAPLIPTCVYATGPGRYHVHIDPPMPVSPQDGKVDLMQRVIARFEDFIKERPDQWYAFRAMFTR